MNAVLDPLLRLSVIIPTFNCRREAERAVQSILGQPDPIGTEIVVVDGDSRDGTVDHLSAVFSNAIAEKRLSVHPLGSLLDRGALRNEGVRRSQGAFLAFLDPEDHWRPGRLQELETHLSKRDLILATDGEIPPDGTDWIKNLIASNWALTSSAVIRRSLFEEMGGFPELSSGVWVKRLPGMEDYEFWLRCVSHLSETGQKGRLELIRNRTVAHGESLLPVSLRLGKVKTFRETLSRFNLLRTLPLRYLPTLARSLIPGGSRPWRGTKLKRDL